MAKVGCLSLCINYINQSSAFYIVDATFKDAAIDYKFKQIESLQAYAKEEDLSGFDDLFG